MNHWHPIRLQRMGSANLLREKCLYILDVPFGSTHTQTCPAESSIMYKTCLVGLRNARPDTVLRTTRRLGGEVGGRTAVVLRY